MSRVKYKCKACGVDSPCVLLSEEEDGAPLYCPYATCGETKWKLKKSKAK